MAVCQNLVPLVNIKIAGKWMFIPLKMVLIGIDPWPYLYQIASKRRPFPLRKCPTCDGLPLGASEVHQGQLGRAVDARLTPPMQTLRR